MVFVYKKGRYTLRCIRPITASIHKSGEGLSYRTKDSVPGLVPFQLPCRKCLPCRLSQAREKATRCWHESQMWDCNIFLTLTYRDEDLSSPWLVQSDFVLFFERLRERVRYRSGGDQKIFCMYTGEYGEENQRPHWHAIVFNFFPHDARPKYKNFREDRVMKSEFIDDVWFKGETEFGTVTMDSANYVARYAAKKLVHGNDGEHPYEPIHRCPRTALGRSWIEKFWFQTFRNGYVLLPNFSKAKIPRYYVDWCKKFQPEEYERYVTEVRPRIIADVEATCRREEMEFVSQLMCRSGFENMGINRPLSRSKVQLTVLESKFKSLQGRLKL